MATSEALDYESGSRVLEEKKRRDALIALAERQGWVVGYQDEVWWSRVSQPNLHSWNEKDEPLRLQELSKRKDDPDPKALACYGMLEGDGGRMHLRFVSGRPVRQVTTNAPSVALRAGSSAEQTGARPDLG